MTLRVQFRSVCATLWLIAVKVLTSALCNSAFIFTKGVGMPFTVEQFLDVFSTYNLAVWPLQIPALLAGLLVIFLIFRPGRAGAAIIAAVLSAMWLVNGIGYHWTFFATINPMARVFAAVFVLEAVILGAVAITRRDLRFQASRSPVSVFGLICIIYAFILYPLIGWLAGHRYPAIPMFGIAPCPTTLFTIGVLLQARWREVRWLAIVPGVWAGVGGSASFLLGVPQDYALFVALAGMVALALGLWRRAAD